jgi:transposase
MNKPHKHTIQFSQKDLAHIQGIIHKGKHNTRTITRARILLLTSKGEGKDAIAAELGIGRSTVQRTRDHYREGRLPRALYDAPRPGQPPKLDDKAEAHLVAIACSDPPKGRDHWTLELLQERMIQDGKVKNISTVALWKRLKKRGIKPWREKNVVHSRGHA